MKTFTIILSILAISTNVAFAKKYKPLTQENCIEAWDADCPDEDFCEKCNRKFAGNGSSPLDPEYQH